MDNQVYSTKKKSPPLVSFDIEPEETEEEKKKMREYRLYLTTRRNGSIHWPGTAMLTKRQIKLSKIHNYYGKHKELKEIKFHNYQQIFNMKHGWDQRLHRDDRHHFFDIGKGFYKEEKERKIPVLSSSEYGKRMMRPLEEFDRRFLRVCEVCRFYRVGGTGLPPLQRDPRAKWDPTYIL